MFYAITNQELLQPAPGIERFCVSKCRTVPDYGMNIDLDVVKYSDVDFSNPVQKEGPVSFYSFIF